MSIFGDSYPKCYITSGSDILLENSLLEADYVVPQTLEHVSVLNGNINYVTLDDRSEMNLTVYLYKYDDPVEKFAEIKTIKGQEVVFYPHADGEPLKDRIGGVALMYVEEIKPFYLFQTTYYDALKISLKSKGTTRLTALAQSMWGYGFNYGDYYGSGM